MTAASAGQRGKVFRDLLRRYRATRTPQDLREHGLPVRLSRGRGPQVPGLRQADVDAALGLGSGVYQRVESGALKPSPQLFDRLTDLLRFSRHDVRVGQLDLFGTEPPLPVGPVSARWRQVVDSHSEVAFVISANGDLLAANSAFTALFPSGRSPRNWWRWSLLDLESRKSTLTDWTTVWAPRLLADFMLAAVRHPDEPVLRAIRSDIEQDPDASSVLAADRGIDGLTLPLSHAARGPGHAHPLIAACTGATLVVMPLDLSNPAPRTCPS